MHVTRRQTCRVCGSKALKVEIDLGAQHLQGRFPKPGERTPERKLPMRLLRCDPHADERACGLLQAEYTVPPEMMYQSYWYRSGTNATMRDHLHSIANNAMRYLIDCRAPKVLDIGCNDGTLLNFYPHPGEGFERWGVDPSNITSKIPKEPDLHILNDFFPARGLPDKMSAVTAIAMFYDLEDPVGFVQQVATLLDQEGVFIFEMSHLPAMLRQNSYDTICHEHIEYYSFAVIEKILAKAGMRAVRVLENGINGGSIQVHAMRWDVQTTIDPSVARMREREFDMCLDTSEPYEAFQKRADLHRADLRELLFKLHAEGKKIHVYGASTKGNTLLQWCGIDRALIECAADRNPEKDGAATPGTNIPIVTEEASRAMKPDYYLVLPWHFKDEFVVREKAMLDAGTKFIFPLPKIEIVG